MFEAIGGDSEDPLVKQSFFKESSMPIPRHAVARHRERQKTPERRRREGVWGTAGNGGLHNVPACALVAALAIFGCFRGFWSECKACNTPGSMLGWSSFGLCRLMWASSIALTLRKCIAGKFSALCVLPCCRPPP